MNESTASGSFEADAFTAADLFGATHPGKVRQINEDQFLVASLNKSTRVHQSSLRANRLPDRVRGSMGYVLAVADGLGGHEGGEIASTLAIETMIQHLGETISCFYAGDTDEELVFLEQLEGAVMRAHDKVSGQAHGAEGAPASTLTMAALAWPRAYIVHVGDSRAYYLRESRLRQITRDQTVYEQVLDAGVLSEAQLATSDVTPRLRSTLTSAIGSKAAPEVSLVDLMPGDALLLCSDGLTRHVKDDEIAGVLLANRHAEDACRRLIGLALERGGADNITVIVARFPAI